MKRVLMFLFAVAVAASFGLTACTKSKEVKEEGATTPPAATEEAKVKPPEAPAQPPAMPAPSAEEPKEEGK